MYVTSIPTELPANFFEKKLVSPPNLLRNCSFFVFFWFYSSSFASKVQVEGSTQGCAIEVEGECAFFLKYTICRVFLVPVMTLLYQLYSASLRMCSVGWQVHRNWRNQYKATPGYVRPTCVAWLVHVQNGGTRT